MQSLINRPKPASDDWREEGSPSRAPFGFQRYRGPARSSQRSWYQWCKRRSRVLSRLGFVGALVFLAATGAYGIALGGQWEEKRQSALDALDRLALAAGLGIADVTVQGNANLKRAEIIDMLGVRGGLSIFAFDTGAARDRLRQSGWVREARVMRLLPSTLVVEIEERAPFAIWREGGESVAIDASGRVLAKATSPAFPLLPVVSGPGAAAPAKEFLDLLKTFPALASRVRDIERIAGRRWDLLLDTGLRAKLPAGQVEAALAELNDMTEKNPAALYEVAELDLRLGSQFTLRLKDGSEDGRKKFLSWFSKARGSRENTL